MYKTEECTGVTPTYVILPIVTLTGVTLVDITETLTGFTLVGITGTLTGVTMTGVTLFGYHPDRCHPDWVF